MVFLGLLFFARPVAAEPQESFYIDNPYEYDDLSEDPWMDPHSDLTTTTTTPAPTPKCQKICRKVCPTTSTTITTTTTTQQVPILQCENGFIKLKVYDKDYALIILGIFGIASIVLHVLQFHYRNRRVGPRQEIYALAPRNPDLADDRVAIVNRLEEEEEEDERWNAQWENERYNLRNSTMRQRR